MPSRKRSLVLGLLLILTLAAVVWVSGEPNAASDEMAAAASGKEPGPRKAQTSKSEVPDARQSALALDRLQRSAATVGDVDPFGVKTWDIPPPPSPEPPPEPPSPPPPPAAPELPFVYMGRMEEDGGGWIVYLLKGEQFYAVAKGETFDDAYRIEAIEKGNLVIQYLPLSIKQYLPIGSES